MSGATLICEHLRNAKKTEDIFGVIAEGPLAERKKTLRHLFNDFARVIHPDRNPGIADAGVHLARLPSLRREAEELLEAEIYGKPRKLKIDATLRSRAGTYNVLEEYRVG